MPDESETAPVKPQGMVAVFTDKEGYVIANVSDFKTDRPGGVSQIEAQKYRVGHALSRAVINAYCSRNIWAGATVRAEWRAAAEAVPLESRQAFLDAVWAGKKVKEAYEIAGISFEAAMGVMGMNISRTTYTTLNQKAV